MGDRPNLTLSRGRPKLSVPPTPSTAMRGSVVTVSLPRSRSVSRGNYQSSLIRAIVYPVLLKLVKSVFSRLVS